MTKSTLRILKTFIKILTVLITSVVLFLVLTAVLFIIPPTGNFISKRIVNLVERNLNTHIEVESIKFIPPGALVLNKFYLEGNDKDTLVWGDRLYVSVNLLPLLNNTIDIDRVELKNAKIRLIRSQKDSVFNFVFSDPKTAEQDSTTSKPFGIKVGLVELETIKFLLDDPLSGNLINAELNRLNLNMDKLDIQNNHYRLRNFLISEANVSFNQGESSETEDSSASISTDFTIELLRTGEIKNSNVTYSTSDGNRIQAQNINLVLKDQLIDIKQKRIDAEALQLNNTRLTITLPRDNLERNDTAAQSPFTLPDWDINLKRLELKKNHFSYNMEGEYDAPEPKNRGVLLDDINVSFNDFYLNSTEAGVQIKQISGVYNKTISLNAFQAGLALKKQALRASGLKLNTGNSSLVADLELFFTDINSAIQNPGSIQIENAEQQAKVNVTDIGILFPTLKDSFPRVFNSGRSIKFISGLSGKVDSINIDALKLNSDDLLRLNMHGLIVGLGTAEPLYADLSINEIWTHYKELKPYLESVSVPDGLNFPDAVQLTGTLKGSITDVRSKLHFASVQGNILADVYFRSDTLIRRNELQASIQMPDYELGELLNKRDTIGKITTAVEFDLGTLEGKIEKLSGSVTVDSVSYMGYTYKDMLLKARQQQDTILADFCIKDPNLKAHTQAKYLQKDLAQYMEMTLNLDYLSLQDIKLNDEDIRMSGQLRAQVEGIIPDHFKAHLVLGDILVNSNNTLFYPDSVSINAFVGDTSEIMVSSPFLDVDYKGTISPLQLGNVFSSSLPSFLGFSDKADTYDMSNKHFNFSLTLRQDPVYTSMLLPDLINMDASSVEARYSGSNGLNLMASIPYLEYASLNLDSLQFDLSSNSSALNYQLGFNSIKSGKMSVPATSLKGNSEGSTLYNTLDLPERNNTSKYFLLANLERTNADGFKLHLVPDRLILNRDPWLVSPENAIIFNKEQVVFQDVTLTRGGDSLSISNVFKADQNKTIFSFVNFNLKTLAAFASYEGGTPAAKINGDVSLINTGESTALASDVIIKNIEVFGHSIFESMELKAQQAEAKTYDFKLLVLDKGNRSSLSGIYAAGDNTALNMDVDLNQFNITPFEPFLSEQFHTLRGSLSGGLSLKGSMQQPVLDGTVTIDTLTINPVAINSPLYMRDATLSIKKNTVVFKNNSLFDRNQNKAELNGSVAYTPENTTFNMVFKARDFLFLDKPENDQSLYYGKLLSDVDADIKGNLNKLVVTMKMLIKEGSDLHFTVPESSKDPGEDEGVAAFIVKDTSLLAQTSQNLSYTSVAADVTANISFQDYIPLSILIDPVSKEEIKVKGKGDLSLKLKGNTEPSLAGRYTINSGSYSLLLYDVFRRTFNIRSGSYLLWTGDVLKPQVNIAAAYDVRTSPLGLVANDLNVGRTDLSQYRKTMPFSVVMNLNGDMLAPDIDFNIETVPGSGNALVSESLNRLNSDESAVNKQVLSLLVFKTFMNQSVSGPDMSYTLNNTARNGLSNILSSSFNQFAQNYIKGVNLSLDVESRASYAGGSAGNTDLVFGASKTMFNDRLTVEVGSSINLENEDNTPSGSNAMAGDFLIEYKLTEDGVVNLQAFRSSEYEDVLVGDVTKTGVAIKLRKVFYNFSDLFKRNKRKAKAGEVEND